MGSLSISANSRADLPPSIARRPYALQEAGDLSPQLGDVEQVAHGTGTIEELSLQLFRYGVPLHDDRRSQAPKNVLLRGGEGGRHFAILFGCMQSFLKIVREPFLVVGKRREAALPRAESGGFLRVTRLGQLCKLRGFRAIELGGKHAANPLFAELVGPDRRRHRVADGRCTVDIGTRRPISEASAEL
jgi:hypothetical protein